MARRRQHLRAEIAHLRQRLTRRDNRARSLQSFLGGLALGTRCGAALTLMLAPQSGEETREQVHREASALEVQAQAALGQVRERAHSLADRAEDQAKSLASSTKDTSEVPSLATDGEVAVPSHP